MLGNRHGGSQTFLSPRIGLAPVAGAVLFAAACVTPPLESPPPEVIQQTTIRVDQNLKNKVDVLFMIDNSSSMDAMQTELKNKFMQFFQPFVDLASSGTYADLHIGVVTSDFGAGATGAPGCDPSPGGQRGQLQAVGQFAAMGCQKPTGMANYIQYAFAPGGLDGANNLPAGQNLIQTFTCMASVGAHGCGFEHQLESVYAALHYMQIPANAGFFRDDALLTVVWVTNEDDASAPPVTDIFDKNKTALYGYEDTYRQTRFAITCGSPPALAPYASSGGPLQNCVSAPNLNDGGPGRTYDISRYVNFFTKPANQGGIKTNPLDVVLVGIDAPTDPFEIILTDPGTPGGTDYVQCPTINENSGVAKPCVPMLQHSCSNPQDKRFFGDPAIRLNTVINSAINHGIAEICAADYSPALKKLGDLIVSNLGQGCIPSKLPKASDGTLITDCVVEDVTDNTDGTQTILEVKQCDPATEMTDPTPCWKIEHNDKCAPPKSPDSVGLTIDRHGKMAAPNTTARVSCSTQAG